jgi:hypothetical protein
MKKDLVSKYLGEAKDEDPCWDGYRMVGYKMKNGKKVPNCVPIEDGKPEPMEKQ